MPLRKSIITGMIGNIMLFGKPILKRKFQQSFFSRQNANFKRPSDYLRQKKMLLSISIRLCVVHSDLYPLKKFDDGNPIIFTDSI